MAEAYRAAARSGPQPPPSKRKLPKSFPKRKKEGKALVEEVQAKVKATKSKQHKLATQEFEQGDIVRIFNFDEGQKFKQRKWSKETYEVEKVFKPKTDYGIFEYKVKDVDNRYKGSELLLVPGGEPDNEVADDAEGFWKIKSLVRMSVQKNVPGFIVKWGGKYNPTWEPKAELEKDVPKMVSQFEKNSDREFARSKGKWRVAKKRA